MNVTLGMVLEAREHLKGIVHRTSLVPSKPLSNGEYQVYLKSESLQDTGSFKVRGAYIKIASLSPEERAAGVIASSAGNHAQGVALAAKAFGVPATIVMPEGAPIAKVKGIDLVTEGVITLSRVVQYAKQFVNGEDLSNMWSLQTDGASLIAQMLFEYATDINFFVGRAINPAHQNPDLPITFGIKIRLVEDLTRYLEQMGKQIKVSYF